jgi:dTDP-4-dehydrorhamnose reductase
MISIKDDDVNPHTDQAIDLSKANPWVVGAGGMLGRAWCELIDRQGIRHRAAAHADLDITDANQIASALSDQHRVVINCAAYTNVDAAEDDEAEAMKLNAEAVGLLADRCAQTGAVLVHYSTDYVFNGRGTRPYRIDDPIHPLGAYGRTKAAGEKRLAESGASWLLVRVSWLYAPWGRNFVKTMAQLTAEKEQLRVVNDQRGRPSSAEQVAAVTQRLLAAGARGVRHVTDGGECTWYELTCEIARLRKSNCQIIPCTTAEFPRPAPRPAYSVLDITETETLVGVLPHWKNNLAGVVGRIP